MFFPKLKKIKRYIKTNSIFGGYDRNFNIGEHSFYDCENITSDCFPLLTVRKKRGTWCGAEHDPDGNITGFTGIKFVSGNGFTAAANIDGRLCLCSSYDIIFDGKKIANAPLDPEVKNRFIVPFGKNFFIAPDGYYIKPVSRGVNSVTDIYNRKTFTDTTVFTRCDENGTDTANGEFTKITADGISSGFAVGDKIKIYGCDDDSLNGIFKIKALTDNTVVTDCVLNATGVGVQGLKTAKALPVFDFVTEHNNRLWGCRYGKNEAGEFVNELYASKLGDPTSWNSFGGISTDSYVVSLGCSGEFTGTGRLGNDICFFKENHIITVSGSSPADFSVAVFAGRGIEKGSHKSCVNLNEKLFYKSESGIMVYDGTLPYRISEELGDCKYKNAAAGEVNGKYYIAMTDEQNMTVLFVYDTKTGLWHKESTTGTPEFFVSGNNCLYTVNCIYTFPEQMLRMKMYDFYIHDISQARDAADLFSDGYDTDDLQFEYYYVPEEEIEWFAETGALGAENGSAMIIRNITVRLKLEKDAVFRLNIYCDNAKDSTRVLSICAPAEEVISVPVSVPRCDAYRLKFSGSGGCTVYAVSACYEKTSEVTGYKK